MELSGKYRHYLTLLIACTAIVLGLIFTRKFLIEAISTIMIAGIISLLLSPLCSLFERHMKPPIAAALSIFVALLAVILALTAIIIPLFTSAINIYHKLPTIAAYVRSTVEPFIWKLDGYNVIPKDMPDGVIASAMEIGNSALTGIVGFAGSAADIAIAAVVSWYMLMERERILLRLELVIPSAMRQTVLKGAAAARLEIAMYLRGQSIIAVCVGILSAAGLLVIGIDNAIPLGLTAGILNMIPYLGPIIACIPVGALAITQGFVPLLMAIGVLVAVQQIDGLILSPRIVGSSTGFAPPVVMVSILAAGAVWGIAGMLIIMPALILFRTCVRVFIELRQNY